MRISALVLLAGLIVACGARAAPDTHFHGTCTDDAQLFADRACYVTASFNPEIAVKNAGHGVYAPPKCDLTKAVPGKDRIKAAYSLAPDFVRKKLCQLSTHDCDGSGNTCHQLFVTSADTSWGFWEGNDLCNGCLNVYIALSDSLLTGANSSIIGLENGFIWALARGTGSAVPAQLQLFKSPTTNPHFAVYDALAHELGHVLLSDSNADGYLSTHPRRKIAKPPVSNCFRDAILATSWDQATYQTHPERWITFKLNKGDNFKKNHFNWQVLYSNVNAGKYSDAATAIAALYNTNEFASLWAALRPEEDFVETFKYKALADGIGTVTIDLGGGAKNILDSIKNPSADIRAKLQCLNDLGLAPAP